MSKYAYIVTACKKYIPEVNALLNSLDYVGNKEDVHLFYYGFPRDFLDKIGGAFDYVLYLHNISEEEARMYGGEGEILMRRRYADAGQIAFKESYRAVCVLDADMVFVRNPQEFFDLAATGYILGVHKEQNKVYDHEHHKVKGQFIYDPTFVNDKDLCNCPLFIDGATYRKTLERMWYIFTEGYPTTNFRAPDMDAMNLCFLEAGLHNKIIKLSNHSWLGTNESLLKPYTRATMRGDGKIWTENGQEVFSFHGQFYKKAWRNTQLANRSQCAQNYLGANKKSNEMAAGAMNVLYNWFKKMCFEHKSIIEKKDYVHPELPYEE